MRAPAQQPQQDLFAERLAAASSRLSPSELKVAGYIQQNRPIVMVSPALQLARIIGTSDATVIRTVKALGFSGLADLRKTLAASSMEQASAPLENMRRTFDAAGESVERAIGDVLEVHTEALAALSRTEAASGAIQQAVRALLPAERIVVFGIGPTAHLARYAAALFTRNGRRASVLDAAGSGLADQLLDLRTGDALLLVAYGPMYRELATVLAEARRAGLPVVLLTESRESSLAASADVVIAAQRGRAGHVALHAVSLAALEALIMGLAACDIPTALGTLDRLALLRKQIQGTARED